ncbi:hypothetical protein EDEG_00529 [Edhazardia aedis USNM 41457]|uniref:Uncharacterized protein n=1 Tax=Edhazardia aedis (strain USNM 41457) TaxID=1003232 RepID=J8ZNK6_EDHAE|nr:hypothetical protein EDEG_00529 [Edhazardia aedis USNM 41457]|eukprot:EJW01268.1 hypothetical protein EDEG_00529 [Edhazardia aedis USNM 41457]
MVRRRQKDKLKTDLVYLYEFDEISNEEVSSIDFETLKTLEECEESCKAKIYDELKWREECEKWECVVDGYFSNVKMVTLFKPINVPIKTDIDIIKNPPKT